MYHPKEEAKLKDFFYVLTCNNSLNKRYTNLQGQRLVRVHTLALKASKDISTVYRSCEMETVIAFTAVKGTNFVS